MALTPSTRALLRVLPSLLLAIAAITLPAGYAHAATPVTGRIGTMEPADIRTTGPHSAISVLLANDHVLFRTGMRAVIGAQPDIHCVAEAPDTRTAITEIARLRPDVAILDLDMPGLGDTTVVDTVAALSGRTRILTLAAAETEENLYRALRLGASGFLTKSLPSEDLISAIRTAAHGDTLIDPQLTRRLIGRLTGGFEPFTAAPEIDTLTTREHQILLLMAKAHTNPEIARALGIGEQTVKTHVSNVLAKLGVRDRVHAVVYAYTRGIVPREPQDVV
ncbi:LuxR C-terminal-related transcriptional regulator [Nocardia sp. NPDC127526]|uniref:LuxR C-terminal-related transcriptional regulator n=1 Tax=Nocardia sp. NPDC127526 TaxID=3345393 RepID=UPI0036268054